MPIQPDSRFANLPVFKVLAPDGTVRQAIGLRLELPALNEDMIQYRVTQGETIDLLARRFYGDERLWWRILDANPTIFPLDIKPGDVLNIPTPGYAPTVTRSRRF